MALPPTTTFVLPGNPIPSALLPDRSSSLKLGPGLIHEPPSTITPTLAGALHVDGKKSILWVENNNNRYTPSASDPVIATVHHSAQTSYACLLTPHSPPVLLPHLSFPNATAKTRPHLVTTSLIYARVLSASRQLPAELTCVSPATGKADGLGELKGGMVFDVSLGLAARLLMAKPRDEGGLSVLEMLGQELGFEVAVGRNGRVWVDSGSVAETLLVGRALMETDDRRVDLEGQKKLVGKLLRELKERKVKEGE